MTAVAVLCATAAVALAFPVSGVLPRPPALRRPLLLLLPLAAVPLVLEGHHLALALIAAGSGVALTALHRRAKGRREADVRRAQVIEACEAIGSELRAGQPPLAALTRARELWPGLDPVVAAGRLDADVPGAFRRLSAVPGAGCLAEVGAAWQVSHAVGAGLALSLDRVVDTARGELATHRVVAGEVASALATARMVALLPVVMLVLADGSGGDPWHFLLATTAGLCCLAGGLALAFAGMAWIERIVSSVLAGAT